LLLTDRTFTAQYEYLTNDGSVFYFVTTNSAPNKRVVKIDINSVDKGWQEIIPESKNLLDECTVIDNDKLVLVYLADVKVLTDSFNPIACDSDQIIIYWRFC
jgi:prolyl oligopeptidase